MHKKTTKCVRNSLYPLF